MLRKTLTILSFLGLLLSTGLWGVSYLSDISYLAMSDNYMRYRGFGVDNGTIYCVDTWTGTLPNFELPLWMPTAVFGAVSCYLVAPILRRRRKRKKLGLCVKCGYNLRGLTEPRCPECNTSFDERLLKKDT